MDKSLVTLLGYLQSAAAFMVIITVLVGVHELGHYLVARAFGMKVDAFAIMMGGIRKTDLRSKLEHPLVSGWIPGLVTLTAGLCTIIFGLKGMGSLYDICLFALAILCPIWIALRLQALYHLPNFGGLRILGSTWAAALGLLLFATRMQGVTAGVVLGMLFYASCIALLVLYYQPVLNKLEDSEQGHGNLLIQGVDVPVIFRPLACRKNREGTEFSLLALPLGGFASIHGMHAREDGSETQIEQGFYSKSPFARFCVLFAGPLFSVVFGIIVLGGYMTANGRPSDKAIVGKLLPGKPAIAAGLQTHDRVVSINGVAVSKWTDMMRQVQPNAGKSLTFVVERQGKQLSLLVTPERSTEKFPLIGADGKFTDQLGFVGQIGVGPATEAVPPAEAFTLAVAAPFQMAAGLLDVVRHPATAKDNIGGPTATVQVVNEARQSGLMSLIFLAGMLSISLGVMNLLPFPPLDGGQIVVAVAEMFRGGARLSFSVQRVVSTIGFFLVIGLIGAVLMIDVARTVSGK